ncbi:MAG: transporter substrate-binding protein [Deltaproteobacteria bacterium]|nr:transporter substrate-binding protein [Deltaproteobacteria bacterium]
MKQKKFAAIIALLCSLAASSALAADKVMIPHSNRIYAFSQTSDVARDSYDLILPLFSLDGGTIDKTYEFAIESRKATVRTEKPVPLSQVRDLSLLREVQQEVTLH